MSCPRTVLLLLVGTALVVMGACSDDSRPDAPGDDDTIAAPDPSPCEQGYRQDHDLPGEFLDDFADGCVPQSCGIGRWGNQEVGEDTFYVDAHAAGGGDGSGDAPFSTIQVGLDAAGEAGGGMVAVAAGTYVENLLLTQAHDGVRLAGRCQELVVVDAGAGAEDQSGIQASSFAGDTEWDLSGMTVTDAPHVGVLQVGGYLDMTAITVAHNQVVGIMGDGPQSHMSLIDVEIVDTQPSPDETFGRGLSVERGARLEAASCLVSGNTEDGVIALNEGTEVVLQDVEVRDTQPLPDGTLGRGLAVESGARLEAASCLVSGNAEVGIIALDGGTEMFLQDVEVRDTQPLPHGRFGRGIEVQLGAHLEASSCLVSGNADVGIIVQEGARLEATSCLVSGNAEVGIVAASEGTDVALHHVEVRDTQPSSTGTRGWGIVVQEGAHLLATACLISGNTELGIVATLEGTEAVLQDVEVRNTRQGADITVAIGLACQARSTMTATDVVVSQTDGPGLMATSSGRLSCSRCELTDNTFAGAVAWGGSYLGLADAVISGTAANANEGGGFGVYVSDRPEPSSLVVEDTTIEDQPYAALWLDGDGSYSIRNSTLVAGNGMELEYPDGTTTVQHGDAVVATGGVTAWDGTSGLLLEGNEIRDAPRAGVLLDASSATLTDNTFTGNDIDLIWQACVGIEEPSGLSGVPVVDYCPTYNHHIAPLEFNLYLEEAEPLE